jgi:hypothetical protein
MRPELPAIMKQHGARAPLKFLAFCSNDIDGASMSFAGSG